MTDDERQQALKDLWDGHCDYETDCGIWVAITLVALTLVAGVAYRDRIAIPKAISTTVAGTNFQDLH